MLIYLIIVALKVIGAVCLVQYLVLKYIFRAKRKELRFFMFSNVTQYFLLALELLYPIDSSDQLIGYKYAGWLGDLIGLNQDLTILIIWAILPIYLSLFFYTVYNKVKLSLGKK